MKYNVLYRETSAAAPKQGLYSGASEAAIRRELEAKGWRILAIQVVSEGGFWGILKKLSTSKIQLKIRLGVSQSELAMLCEVFRALYSSGVQMLQIVQMTIEETANPWLRKRLMIVLDHLRVGDDLYKSMSDPRCAKAFPPIMRETIRTGEANGRLDVSLARLTDIFKRAAETQRETISALIYPVFALIIFFAVGAVIATLIPKALTEIMGPKEIEAFRSRLPAAIRCLFFLRENPIYLFMPPAIVTGLCLLWSWGKRFHATAVALTRMERKAPVLGQLLYMFALVRFLDMLAANNQTGIQVTESLSLMKGTIKDALIEDSLDRMREDILRNGVSLTGAMSKPSEEDVYPGLVRQMVRAGEGSGKLTEMLIPICEYYEGQAKALLKRLLDLITPIMIVLLGGMIGPVVIGVYKTTIMLAEGAASV